MTGYIPLPPSPWVPIAVNSDTNRPPDEVVQAIADSTELSTTIAVHVPAQPTAPAAAFQDLMEDLKTIHAGGVKYEGAVTLGDPDTATPPEDQGGTGIRGLIGDGGGYSGGLTVYGTAADENETLVQRNNLSGVRLEGLTIHGNGYPSVGLDLSWIGGSSGNPTLAPANLNILEKIWVEGVKDVAINLDKFHDSTVQSIVTRDITGTDPIALQMSGGGGWVGIKDARLYGGRTVFSCQNGQISDSIITHGLELISTSYNHINLDAVHFIELDDYAIKSSATGNGTKFFVADSCYFNALPGGSAGYVQGRFYRGGTFRNCRFFSADITANITSAAGAGALPVFRFEGCTFAGSTWATLPLPVNCIYEFVNCEDSAGAASGFLRVAPSGTDSALREWSESVQRKNATFGTEARTRYYDSAGQTLVEAGEVVSFYKSGAAQDTWYPLPTGTGHNGAFLVVAAVQANPGPKAVFVVTKASGNATADVVRLSPTTEDTEKIELRWRTAADSGDSQIQPEIRVTGGGSARRLAAIITGQPGAN